MNTDQRSGTGTGATASAILDDAAEARRRGHDEDASAFCEMALARARETDDRRSEAHALTALADLALHVSTSGEGSFERRQRLASEALTLFRQIGDRRGEARSLRVLATVTEPEEARGMLEQSLAIARELGDPAEIACALDRLGAQLAMSGDRQRATALKEEALAIFRDLGDRSGIAHALFSLGLSRGLEEDETGRRSCVEEALALYREIGEKKRVAECIMFLAGDPALGAERQIALYTEGRDVCRELGIPMWEASCLKCLADVHERQDDDAQAAALRAEADATYQEPPLDPELEAALLKAFESGDGETARETIKQLFG